MTRRKNEQLGWCTCLLCDNPDAQVSKERVTNRLYYNCEECGCVRTKGGKFQALVLDGFRPLNPGETKYVALGIDPPANDPDYDQAPNEADDVIEEVINEKPAKKSGWFGEV